MITQAQERACVEVLRTCGALDVTDANVKHFFETAVRQVIPCEIIVYRFASIGPRAVLIEGTATFTSAGSISSHTDLRSSIDELGAVWLAREEPLVFSATQHALTPAQISADRPGASKGSIALHGQVDAASRFMSLFCFAGISAPAADTAPDLLHLVVPHLHAVMCKLHRRLTERIAFSRAEIDVIERLLAGKSNKEIARDLNKSEATVRNQLHSVFERLHVSTRAAAISQLSATQITERYRQP